MAAMRRILLLALAGALAVTLSSWGKKKKEEETQVLQLPKDPPSAITAETRRLVFQVTPLSAKGLLSQQTRDALKWLLRSSNGAVVVKLRAFVSGSGDLRRVRELVSETFSEHRLPLPVLSVVQVGALPMELAQVVMEATAVAKKAVNQAEDAMGLQVGMDSVFGLHHLAHAHNAETGTDSLAGHDARSMRDGGGS